MDGYGCVDGWMNMGVLMGGWMNMDGWMDGWIWVGTWVWMDGWMDGCMHGASVSHLGERDSKAVEQFSSSALGLACNKRVCHRLDMCILDIIDADIYLCESTQGRLLAVVIQGRG